MRPDEVRTHEDLARGLTELRTEAGLSIRQVATNADAIFGTVSGWFSGNHVPGGANLEPFRRVLAVCGVSDPQEQDAWVFAAEGVRRRNNRRPSPTVTPPPYRGFEAFGIGDRDWFFGREDIVDLVAATVLEQAENPTAALVDGPKVPVVTLVGASGAGKSSVLRAGLLSQTGLPGPFEQWRHLLFSPGRDPLAAFEAARESLSEGTGPVIVAIDQLEELWTQTSDRVVRGALTEAIIAFADTVPRLVVVTAIRADFYGSIASSPRLTYALQNAHVLVPALGEKQLREVITAPAHKAGLELGDGLVDLMLADLRPGAERGTGTGALPLLSHALHATWSRSDRRRLTVADYLATGGIRGAVEQTAERVYSGLDYAEKVVARRQLLAMTHVDEDFASRRRAELAELGIEGTAAVDVERLDVRQRRAARVVNLFASARLVTVSDTHAELTHEALLSAWPRLAAWIDDDRGNLLILRRLRVAREMWTEADETDDLLPRGGRLDIFTDFADDPVNASRIHPADRRFLDRARAQQDRSEQEGKRRNRVLGAIALLATISAVLALVAAGFAVSARSDALAQRNTAEQLRKNALSARLAAVADQQRAIDPALSVQLAMVANRIAPTEEARSALVDSSAGPLPVRHLTAPGSSRVAHNRDNSLLAVVNSDNKIRLFRPDSRSSGPVSVFGGAQPDKELYAVSFAPDGATLYVAGQAEVQRWDISDPAAPKQLPGPPPISAAVRDLEVDPSGQLLAVAADTVGIVVYRIPATAQAPWVRLGVPADVAGDGSAVAFSPDGRRLAGASGKQRFELYDVAGDQLRVLATVPLPGSSNIVATDIAFAPQRPEIAVGLKSRDMRVYDIGDPARPRLVEDYSDFGSYVNAVDYSPDGSHLLGASSDNTVRVVDRTGIAGPQALRAGAVVTSAVYVGERIASVSEDGALRVWPAARPGVQSAVDQSFQFAFTGDGTALITGNARTDGSLSQWRVGPGADLQSRGPLLSAPAGTKFTSLSYSADGRLAVVGGVDGRVYFGDYSDPTRPVLAGPGVAAVPGLVETVDVSTRSNLAVAATLASSSVAVLDVTDPSRPTTVSTVDVGTGNGPAWAAMSADGRRAVVTTDRGAVLLIDLSDPRRPRILFRQQLFATLALAARFSPDQRSLVVSSATRQVKIIDISRPTTPVVTSEMTGPSSTIYGATFSRDGRLVAVGGADNQVWVWDVSRRGHPVEKYRLQAYPGRIYDVMFGPDDRTVLAAGAAGVIQSWALDAEAIAASVCSSGTAAITETEWQRYLPGQAYDPPCRR
ncbi:PD40 domain-containing protein [Williamsia sp. CHRR-6]|uniref:nSTAND1 domain-containing NTPase n=1 Tax=Williamsia sp. CHRR-6 TaxID=2835871 RepID=UPI001BDA43DD|nr:PD40 domain-containing protein [Williamsia sp. CHRR-6]MBT0565785.1 PD40 domain-containing protein [Williamsia sp. CHRR-6]